MVAAASITAVRGALQVGQHGEDGRGALEVAVQQEVQVPGEGRKEGPSKTTKQPTNAITRRQSKARVSQG